MSQVHWFPGHMAKAIRLIEEQLKAVDFVIECRDARAPNSTRNPVLAHSLGEKKRLIVLTKKDLADPEKTQEWVERLEAEGNVVVAVNVLQDNVKKVILQKQEEVLVEKREREKRRGMRPRTARALIVGVPNVGKSSIINKIGSRNVAAVANRAGVTQALKLIRVDDMLELVDTPGILWPKFETPEQGIICALIGSVRETGYPLGLITDFARDYLIENAPEKLKSVYKLDNLDNFFTDVGRFKTFLDKAGSVEIEKTRLHFLIDLQAGRLGRITWD